ncbi:thioredoxin-like domain-containing protein [Oscillatoria salina]|uniref:thioredoxin-like domain-containing protein n=1 Tax=Oscillatoria salina TaxID=331517 RepID=UPI0029624801|nr:thioredoxin-like domain-containing protein [Oscillatoria salina]
MTMTRVRAPEFPIDATWLNTNQPLTLKQLRGSIVLLDFWTYCCLNCLHVLPDLKYLEKKYPNSLTVIGVHSAKFDNEKEAENVRQAILRYDIEHPVVLDSNLTIWGQYAVRAWPTLMLIDPEGYVVGYLSGEGNRQVLDRSIAEMIREMEAKGTINFPQLSLSLEKQQRPLTTPLAFPGKVLAEEESNGGAELAVRCFIADTGHHRIVVSNSQGEVLQIVGTGKSGFQDGSFDEAEFGAPQGMAWDGEKACLYVADTENHAIRCLDFNRKQVKTIAGTGEQSRNIHPQQGEALATAFNSPWDLEKIGERLYIAMAGSHQIWSMDLNAGTVETYAGIGREACFNGSLTEAAFAQPSGITTDGKELFVADSEVSSIRGVGLIEPAKSATGTGATAAPIVRTVCGSGELFGFGDKDEEGFEVRLQHCLGVEYAQNYLWIADTYNHKIKRVDPKTGICQTLLGDVSSGNKDGCGTAAQFSEPSGLSATSSHLYIADTNNHQIRVVELATLSVKTLPLIGLCAPSVCLPK